MPEQPRLTMLKAPVPALRQLKGASNAGRSGSNGPEGPSATQAPDMEDGLRPNQEVRFLCKNWRRPSVSGPAVPPLRCSWCLLPTGGRRGRRKTDTSIFRQIIFGAAVSSSSSSADANGRRGDSPQDVPVPPVASTFSPEQKKKQPERAASSEGDVCL